MVPPPQGGAPAGPGRVRRQAGPDQAPSPQAVRRGPPAGLPAVRPEPSAAQCRAGRPPSAEPPIRPRLGERAGPPDHGRRGPIASRRPGRGARQASGAQAGQGPRRRPGGAHRRPARSGSITREDIHGARRRRRRRAAAAPTPSRADRRASGRSASRSRACARRPRRPWWPRAFTAPHVTEFLQVDVTETMDAVERLRRAARLRRGQGLAAAAGRQGAAGRGPAASDDQRGWDEAAQEIVVKHYVNLGIAAATPRGLLVPNIKDAHAPVPAGPGPGAGRAGRDRPGGPYPARGHGRRHDHDHQRGRVRGGRRAPRSSTRASRPSSPSARSGTCRGCVDGQIVPRKVTHARALVRPPHRRRRARLALPARRRRHAAGPAPHARLELTRDGPALLVLRHVGGVGALLSRPRPAHRTLRLSGADT